MIKPSRKNRFISVLLALLMVSTNCVLPHAAESNFWANRKQNLQLAKLPSHLSPLSSIPPKKISINSLKTHPSYSKDQKLATVLKSLPHQYGSVRKITEGSSGKIVIHIQDVHHNSEAQTNIGLTLQSLIENQKVDLVALEGAFEPINLEPFQQFHHKPTIKQVTDFLLENHKIAGPIHTLLNTPNDSPRIVGVDDRGLYEANVEAVRKVYAEKETVKKDWEKRQQLLESQKKEVFNASLLEFDGKVARYRVGNLELGDYSQLVAPYFASIEIQKFLEAFHLEKNLKFSRVVSERTFLLSSLLKKLDKKGTSQLMSASVAYRTGQLGHEDFYSFLMRFCENHGIRISNFPAMQDYLRYLTLSNSLDAETLLSDLRDAEAASYDYFIVSNEEHKLVFESREHYLTGKLIDLALTKGEWTELKEGRSTNDEPRWNFVDFYRYAEARDKAIAQNLQTEIDNQNAKVSVLVTGGFHSKGIHANLTGPTLVSFVPKITRVDSSKGTSYLSLFAQEKTPLQKLFEGEKLFLSQKAWPAHLQKTTATLFVAVGSMLGLLLGSLQSMTMRMGLVVKSVLVKPQFVSITTKEGMLRVPFKDKKLSGWPSYKKIKPRGLFPWWTYPEDINEEWVTKKGPWRESLLFALLFQLFSITASILLFVFGPDKFEVRIMWVIMASLVALFGFVYSHSFVYLHGKKFIFPYSQSDGTIHYKLIHFDDYHSFINDISDYSKLIGIASVDQFLNEYFEIDKDDFVFDEDIVDKALKTVRSNLLQDSYGMHMLPILIPVFYYFTSSFIPFAILAKLATPVIGAHMVFWYWMKENHDPNTPVAFPIILFGSILIIINEFLHTFPVLVIPLVSLSFAFPVFQLSYWIHRKTNSRFTEGNPVSVVVESKSKSKHQNFSLIDHTLFTPILLFAALYLTSVFGFDVFNVYTWGSVYVWVSALIATVSGMGGAIGFLLSPKDLILDVKVSRKLGKWMDQRGLKIKMTKTNSGNKMEELPWWKLMTIDPEKKEIVFARWLIASPEPLKRNPVRYYLFQFLRWLLLPLVMAHDGSRIAIFRALNFLPIPVVQFLQTPLLFLLKPLHLSLNSIARTAYEKNVGWLIREIEKAERKYRKLSSTLTPDNAGKINKKLDRQYSKIRKNISVIEKKVGRQLLMSQALTQYQEDWSTFHQQVTNVAFNESRKLDRLRDDWLRYSERLEKVNDEINANRNRLEEILSDVNQGVRLIQDAQKEIRDLEDLLFIQGIQVGRITQQLDNIEDKIDESLKPVVKSLQDEFGGVEDRIYGSVYLNPDHPHLTERLKRHLREKLSNGHAEDPNETIDEIITQITTGVENPSQQMMIENSVEEAVEDMALRGRSEKESSFGNVVSALGESGRETVFKNVGRPIVGLRFYRWVRKSIAAVIIFVALGVYGVIGYTPREKVYQAPNLPSVAQTEVIPDSPIEKTEPETNKKKAAELVGEILAHVNSMEFSTEKVGAKRSEKIKEINEKINEKQAELEKVQNEEKPELEKKTVEIPADIAEKKEELKELAEDLEPRQPEIIPGNANAQTQKPSVASSKYDLESETITHGMDQGVGGLVAVVENGTGYIVTGTYSRLDPKTGKYFSNPPRWTPWELDSKRFSTANVSLRSTGRTTSLLLPPNYVVVGLSHPGQIEFDTMNRLWRVTFDRNPGNFEVEIAPANPIELPPIPDFSLVEEQGDGWLDEFPDNHPIKRIINSANQLPLEKKRQILANILNLIDYSTNPYLEQLSDREPHFMKMALTYFTEKCDGFCGVERVIGKEMGIPGVIQSGILDKSGTGRYMEGNRHNWVLTPEGIIEPTSLAGRISPLYEKKASRSDYQQEIRTIIAEAPSKQKRLESLADLVDVLVREEQLQREIEEAKESLNQMDHTADVEVQYQTLLTNYRERLRDLHIRNVPENEIPDLIQSFKIAPAVPVHDDFRTQELKLMAMGHFLMSGLTEIAETHPIYSQEVEEAKEEVYILIRKTSSHITDAMFKEEKIEAQLSHRLMEPPSPTRSQTIFGKNDLGDFVLLSPETTIKEFYVRDPESGEERIKRKEYYSGPMAHDPFRVEEIRRDPRTGLNRSFTIHNKIDNSQRILDATTDRVLEIPMGNDPSEYSQGIFVVRAKPGNRITRTHRITGFKTEYEHYLSFVPTARYPNPTPEIFKDIQLYNGVIRGGRWLAAAHEYPRNGRITAPFKFLGTEAEYRGLENNIYKRIGTIVGFPDGTWMAPVLTHFGSFKFVGPAAEVIGLENFLIRRRVNENKDSFIFETESYFKQMDNGNLLIVLPSEKSSGHTLFEIERGRKKFLSDFPEGVEFFTATGDGQWFVIDESNRAHGPLAIRNSIPMQGEKISYPIVDGRGNLLVVSEKGQNPRTFTYEGALATQMGIAGQENINRLSNGAVYLHPVEPSFIWNDNRFAAVETRVHSRLDGDILRHQVVEYDNLDIIRSQWFLNEPHFHKNGYWTVLEPYGLVVGGPLVREGKLVPEELAGFKEIVSTKDGEWIGLTKDDPFAVFEGPLAVKSGLDQIIEVPEGFNYAENLNLVTANNGIQQIYYRYGKENSGMTAFKNQVVRTDYDYLERIKTLYNVYTGQFFSMFVPRPDHWMQTLDNYASRHQGEEPPQSINSLLSRLRWMSSQESAHFDPEFLIKMVEDHTDIFYDLDAEDLSFLINFLGTSESEHLIIDLLLNRDSTQQGPLKDILENVTLTPNDWRRIIENYAKERAGLSYDYKSYYIPPDYFLRDEDVKAVKSLNIFAGAYAENPDEEDKYRLNILKTITALKNEIGWMGYQPHGLGIEEIRRVLRQVQKNSGMPEWDFDVLSYGKENFWFKARAKLRDAEIEFKHVPGFSFKEKSERIKKWKNINKILNDIFEEHKYIDFYSGPPINYFPSFLKEALRDYLIIAIIGSLIYLVTSFTSFILRKNADRARKKILDHPEFKGSGPNRAKRFLESLPPEKLMKRSKEIEMESIAASLTPIQNALFDLARSVAYEPRHINWRSLVSIALPFVVTTTFFIIWWMTGGSIVFGLQLSIATIGIVVLINQWDLLQKIRYNKRLVRLSKRISSASSLSDIYERLSIILNKFPKRSKPRSNSQLDPKAEAQNLVSRIEQNYKEATHVYIQKSRIKSLRPDGSPAKRGTNQGTEVDDIRKYSPGDDIRHLNWKVWARSDRYYVNKHLHETMKPAAFLVDLRNPETITESQDWLRDFSQSLIAVNDKRRVTGEKNYTLDQVVFIMPDGSMRDIKPKNLLEGLPGIFEEAMNLSSGRGSLAMQFYDDPRNERFEQRAKGVLANQQREQFDQSMLTLEEKLKGSDVFIVGQSRTYIVGLSYQLRTMGLKGLIWTEKLADVWRSGSSGQQATVQGRHSKGFSIHNIKGVSKEVLEKENRKRPREFDPEKDVLEKVNEGFLSTVSILIEEAKYPGNFSLAPVARKLINAGRVRYAKNLPGTFRAQRAKDGKVLILISEEFRPVIESLKNHRRIKNAGKKSLYWFFAAKIIHEAAEILMESHPNVKWHEGHLDPSLTTTEAVAYVLEINFLMSNPNFLENFRSIVVGDPPLLRFYEEYFQRGRDLRMVKKYLREMGYPTPKYDRNLFDQLLDLIQARKDIALDYLDQTIDKRAAVGVVQVYLDEKKNVEASVANGNGVLIGEDDDNWYFVTNHHVVDGYRKGHVIGVAFEIINRILFYDSINILIKVGKIFKTSRKHDLAVIQVKKDIDDIPWISDPAIVRDVKNKKELNNGGRVKIVGYRGNSDPERGSNIKVLNGQGVEHKVLGLWVNGRVYKGQSGSGVYDEDGYLIGVLYAGKLGKNSRPIKGSVAVWSSSLIRFLKRHKVPFKMVENGASNLAVAGRSSDAFYANISFYWWLNRNVDYVVEVFKFGFNSVLNAHIYFAEILKYLITYFKMKSPAFHLQKFLNEDDAFKRAHHLSSFLEAVPVNDVQSILGQPHLGKPQTDWTEVEVTAELVDVLYRINEVDAGDNPATVAHIKRSVSNQQLEKFVKGILSSHQKDGESFGKPIFVVNNEKQEDQVKSISRQMKIPVHVEIRNYSVGVVENIESVLTSLGEENFSSVRVVSEIDPTKVRFRTGSPLLNALFVLIDDQLRARSVFMNVNWKFEKARKVRINA